MVEQRIACPNCGKKIPISKVLTSQIEADLRKTLEAEARKRDKEVQAAYERKLKAEIAQREKQAKREAEKATSAILAKLRKKLAEAEKREKIAQVRYEQKLASEMARLEERAKKEAAEESASELADLRKQLRDRDKRLKDIQKQEQELRKQQEQLAAREKLMESELARARRKVEEEITERLTAEYQAKEQEDSKKLSELRKQVIELKQKLEQGSQQRQGEVGEEAIEDILRKHFPHDQIKPVSKGKAGADVLQQVYTQSGQYCGTIVWESKKTKTWSKKWLSKLKSDQRKAKAELAVLVSTALPKEISRFAQVDGVWVTEFSLVLGVATALRTNLIQVTIAKGAAVGKNVEVKELLYDYLTGMEFKHRVEAIIEAFRSMQDDLKKEKQAIEKNWAKREMQIQTVVQNIAGMYGDMQGLGAALPRIKRLELPAPTDD